MEIILITGLDGSGKSTIFSALESQKVHGSFEVLKLPFIDSGDFYSNSALHDAAGFINHINQKADKENRPQLKAIALFASMLLFGKLVEHKNHPGVKKIYCERHPLIDSGVYSLFYADKVKTGSSGTIDFEIINNQFKNEIEFIVDIIPEKILVDKKPTLECLAKFIYKWFFTDKKTDVVFLSELFGIGLPDKIYYLKAKPEILIDRLSGRKIFEAHESLAILSELNKAYDLLFKRISKINAGVLNIIDANSFENLNEFQQFIESDCRK